MCSALNEGLASVLGWRAATLEDGIRNVLGDQISPQGPHRWLGGVRVPPKPDVGVLLDDLTGRVFEH